ncbi:hypothetical protein BJV82DRAFT_576549 [Fennellomyces sp. T-0311]|nr:hypothetical protein BJV82DRAFT_576549 [Fennellomyces sp. T-0311]
MCGFHFHLFVFGKACSHDIQVGRVVGIFKPTIVFSSDLKADIALSVKDKAQLLLIGDSQDLIQCSAFVRKDKQCPAMLDGRTGTLCDLHITNACKASKNTRMELASGALEVRWAKLSAQGYQATQPERRLDKEYTYIFKGRGPITSDGTELHVKNPKTYAEDVKEKEALARAVQRGDAQDGVQQHAGTYQRRV